MDAVALTARQNADFLLLVAALEVERAHIGPARHFMVAQHDHVIAARNLFPDVLVGIERVARLVHIPKLHGLAEGDGAAIGFLFADDHLEQGGLTRAVRTDHADNAARRQFEVEIIDQQAIIKAFRHMVEIHYIAAQARARRNADDGGRDLFLLGCVPLLFIGFDTRLGFGLTRFRRGADPVELAQQGALLGALFAGFLRQALGLLLQPV